MQNAQKLLTDDYQATPRNPAFAAQLRLIERASVAAQDAEHWTGETGLAQVRRRDAFHLIRMAQAIRL